MSLRFEVEGNELRIEQRRRGLKIFMWLVFAGSIGGLAIVPLINSLPHTGQLTCDRAAGTCKVTYEPTHDVREIKLAEITNARTIEDHGTLAVILDRNDSKLKHQWVCQAPADHADAKAVRAAGETIAGFLVGAPGAPTLDVTCPNHGGEFNALFLIPAVALGDLILLLMLGFWLQEAHTVIDKGRRITMRGRSGLRTKWKFERPVSEIVGVSLEKRYVMRGNYRHLVFVHFNDGTKTMAMAPAFYKLPTLESRTAELRKFLGL